MQCFFLQDERFTPKRKSSYSSGTFGKNKNRQPIGAAAFAHPADLFGEFPTTHRRELPFPINGTSALHCQVARILSKSFLMLI